MFKEFPHFDSYSLLNLRAFLKIIKGNLRAFLILEYCALICIIKNTLGREPLPKSFVYGCIVGRLFTKTILERELSIPAWSRDHLFTDWHVSAYDFVLNFWNQNVGSLSVLSLSVLENIHVEKTIETRIFHLRGSFFP